MKALISTRTGNEHTNEMHTREKTLGFRSLSPDVDAQVRREVAAMNQLSNTTLKGVPCTAIRHCTESFYDARQTVFCMVLCNVGQTAKDVLDDRTRDKLPVVEDDVVRMALDCMTALECMHDRGWRHTDHGGKVGLNLAGITRRVQTGFDAARSETNTGWIISDVSTARKMDHRATKPEFLPNEVDRQQDIRMLGLAVIEFALGYRPEVIAMHTTLSTPITTETDHPILAHAPKLVQDLSAKVSKAIAEVAVCAAAEGYSCVEHMRDALMNAIEEEDGYFLSHVQADKGLGTMQMMGLKTRLTEQMDSFFKAKLARAGSPTEKGKTRNGNDLIWLDQDETPSVDGMTAGVARKKNFLLFLTADYFTKEFCRLELTLAIKAKKNIVLVECVDRELGAAATFGDYIKQCNVGMQEEREKKDNHTDLGSVFASCVAIPYYTDKTDVESGKVKEPVFYEASLSQILNQGKAVGGGSYSLTGGQIQPVVMPTGVVQQHLRILVWHASSHTGDHEQAVTMGTHLQEELTLYSDHVQLGGNPVNDDTLLRTPGLHVLMLVYLTQRTLELPGTVRLLNLAAQHGRPVIVLRETDTREMSDDGWQTSESVFGAVEMDAVEQHATWAHFQAARAQFVPFYRAKVFRTASYRTVLSKWFAQIPLPAWPSGTLGSRAA